MNPQYLQRAIDIASKGLTNTSPNPHVGAVIVASCGRIIGEGYHRKCGEGHAEVNAIASVRPEDRHLLADSTIYVTLEPCSHYGKTPPCAKLIADTGIPRVVVGTGDPNPKVNGNGIRMLREAGIAVELATGDMERACRDLDPEFMSRYTHGRPFITLKWAKSADGFMAAKEGEPVRFSTPLTTTLVHKLRAEHDIILTSGATVAADNPRLDTRFWSAAGKTPAAAVITRRTALPPDSHLLRRQTPPVIYNCSVAEAVADIGKRGFNSILVEAGPTLLSEFLTENLFDTIRIETSPLILGENGGCPAPAIPPDLLRTDIRTIDGNIIEEYIQKR